MRNNLFLCLLFIFANCTHGQGQSTQSPADLNKPEIRDSVTSDAPIGTARVMDQDKNGSIWISAFDGVFKYDGQSFKNVGGHLTSDRFFSVLADRQGNIWFASMGSGVYKYDGKSFRNFTTKDGLIYNAVLCMYEDRSGNIWFGGFGGASRYDGSTFRNYRTNGDSMTEDTTVIAVSDFPRPDIEVTAIVEDKAGNLWFSTRGNTFRFDGTTFTVFEHEGNPFINVRCLIADRKGNIWLGGSSLWRYNGTTCTKFTQRSVIYICEDKAGNIWTSSQPGHNPGWVLSRYDAQRLNDTNPIATELSTHPVIWSILAADDGTIWFGAVGVFRYDGKVITHFKNKEG